MYTPVFTRPPESWDQWWSAVRRFAASWYGIPAGDVTGYHPDAEALGRQLGVPLSPSIHEWAAFVADLRREGVERRALRDRFTLGWDEDIAAVTLLTLAEGDVCWGVRRAHLAEDDPPADCWQLASGDCQGWEPGGPDQRVEQPPALGRDRDVQLLEGVGLLAGGCLDEAVGVPFGDPGPAEVIVVRGAEQAVEQAAEGFGLQRVGHDQTPLIVRTSVCPYRTGDSLRRVMASLVVGGGCGAC